MIAIIFFFLITILISYLWYLKNLNSPLNQNNQTEINFRIKEGQSAKEIGKNLKETNLIKSDVTFYIYTHFNNFSTQIKAGLYKLNQAQNIKEIIEIITKGANRQLVITIPEGFTIQDIDKMLTKEGIISENEFYDCTQICDFSNFNFLNDAKDLEGYLFPDTYYILPDSSVQTIIEKMLSNFSHKISAELINEIENQNRTLSYVVILASIIQAESPIEDMPNIAGVFWKRLNEGIYLESDATVNYVLGTSNLQPTYKDTEVEHPYNTYENLGLPPGPINNPGLDALKAAIAPNDNPYYFFLSTPEGETIFSKTYQEHLNNKAKYLN